MTSASSVRAGRAYVEIGTRLGPLQAGLRSAQAQLAAFGSSVRRIGAGITAAGAVAAAPLAASVAIFARQGDEIAKAAKRTGLSTEAMSELGFAARRSGSSMEELEGGLRIMQRTIAEARSGSGAAAEALDRLGLSVGQIASLSPDQQLVAIADGLASIQDPADRTAAAMAVFGRGGTALIPLLEGGSAAMAEMRRQARALGQSLGAADAKSAEDLSDAFADVREAVGGVAKVIGAALAPHLTELAEKVASGISTFGRWLDQNRGLVSSISAVVAGVLAAGAVITGLGIAITVGSAALGGLATLLGGIAAVAGVAVAAVAALASPLGLVVATAAGAGAAFAYFSDAGRTAFAGLRDTATETLGGIADAMEAGDLQAAAEVLWAGIKLAWAQGIAAIKGMWAELTATIAKAMASLWEALDALVAEGPAIAAQIAGDLGPIIGRVRQGFASGGVGGAVAGGLTGAGISAGMAVAGDPARASAATARQKLFAAIRDVLRGDLEARLGELADEVERSRQAFAKARESAAQARRNAEGARMGPTEPPGAGQRAETEAEMQRQLAAMTRGTFNAAAAQALQSGVTGVEERIAKASERSVELLRRILFRMDGGGAVFTE